ncbi:lipoate--protein ligase family protein [Lederbergia citrea]|uniref:Lipoate--protein ligase family protein n=1 Tax=Lederbergia citrea TaxID=2833581 RepID=A0A942UQ20_9BACI|nr:biotin/lipoate A/B protein ligase family protein [Lederbergia citrea]MBS4179032.1 lipoate--protein ligase family protein [Lederbergia citrea]MBS4223972.1 lipoate--protein ligase family protein [Lederbergia citrea]
MKDKWGLLHTGYNDAAVNMALDEKLLDWHSEGKISPVLRFYGWSKPTLSVGHFQRVDRTIDFNAVEKYQCQFVRRLTGGSAVLHDDELTYSLVVSEQKPYISDSIREAYFTLSKGIMAGFKELGIAVDYSIPEEHFKKNATAVCFERPSDYEMLVDGKKISGHAQTRKKGVLLQHGSLPFSIDEQMLFDLFNFSSEEIRQKQRSTFSEKAISMNDVSSEKITYEIATKAFTKGFENGLNLELVPLKLTDSQWAEVHELAEAKYRSDEWNFKDRKKVLS